MVKVFRMYITPSYLTRSLLRHLNNNQKKSVANVFIRHRALHFLEEALEPTLPWCLMARPRSWKGWFIHLPLR
jgi:hypothetical protein